MKAKLSLSLCLLVLTGTASQAQTAESLKSAFAQQKRLLDEVIDDYGRARAAELSAINGFRQLSQQLDAALEDPNVSLHYLTGLEAQLGSARDAACDRTQQTAQTRKRLYERMESMGAVARDFERQSGYFDTDEQGIEGTWHIEAQPIDVVGLLNLRLNGSQVSGPYHLSNGRDGAVRGTLAGSRLELQVVDSEHGVVATITAEVDSEAGEIQGTWLAMELASGRPSTGDWTASRVSDEEEITLENSR